MSRYVIALACMLFLTGVGMLGAWRGYGDVADGRAGDLRHDAEARFRTAAMAQSTDLGAIEPDGEPFQRSAARNEGRR